VDLRHNSLLTAVFQALPVLYVHLTLITDCLTLCLIVLWLHTHTHTHTPNSFVNQLLGQLPGVDANDPRILAALAAQSKDSDAAKKSEEKKEDKK
jgi:hypothetical protein